MTAELGAGRECLRAKLAVEDGPFDGRIRYLGHGFETISLAIPQISRLGRILRKFYRL